MLYALLKNQSNSEIGNGSLPLSLSCACLAAEGLEDVFIQEILFNTYFKDLACILRKLGLVFMLNELLFIMNCSVH